MAVAAATEWRHWVVTQGYSVEIFEGPDAPMLQWYDKDGKPFPRLFKSDPFHMARWRAKGWTLTPVVVQAAGNNLIEFPTEVSVNGIHAVAQTEVQLPKSHKHKYANKRIGTACLDARCQAKRQRKVSQAS